MPRANITRSAVFRRCEVLCPWRGGTVWRIRRTMRLAASELRSRAYAAIHKL